MNTVNDIFIAEFKNLYAIEKQSVETFSTLSEKIEHKKLKKYIEKCHEKAEKSLEKIHNLLKKNEINPGSTVDSVLQEILLNMLEISNSKLKSDIKSVGIYTSFQRMFSYKKACYRNTLELVKFHEHSSTKKDLKKIYKAQKKLVEKLNSEIQKEILQ